MLRKNAGFVFIFGFLFFFPPQPPCTANAKNQSSPIQNPVDATQRQKDQNNPGSIQGGRIELTPRTDADVQTILRQRQERARREREAREEQERVRREQERRQQEQCQQKFAEYREDYNQMMASINRCYHNYAIDHASAFLESIFDVTCVCSGEACHAERGSGVTRGNFACEGDGCSQDMALICNSPVVGNPFIPVGRANEIRRARQQMFRPPGCASENNLNQQRREITAKEIAVCVACEGVWPDRNNRDAPDCEAYFSAFGGH